jgi:triosephosphate isomerase
MVTDAGCSYVYNRPFGKKTIFGETDETVNKRIKAALNAGLIPIVCVGETLNERESNVTFKVIEKQVRDGI